MKIHTSDYKTAIATPGRMIKNEISYTLNEETVILNDDNLYSVNYNYQGSILKSVMKQLEINCKDDIPLNTVLSTKFSLLVNDEWEDISFGNYVVYKSERQEDTETYKITCYDKMLYSMKDYESMGITYPISIRNYINTICNHLGLTFKNAGDTFANYNKQIQNELYLDAQGNSLGYTFRDVLDELAQVTASTICINEDDDSLEIRYINNTSDAINGDYLKNINVNFGEKYGPVNSIVLSRSAGADNVYLRDEESISQNGLCEIKITDNQIMNFNDRADYLSDILYTLDGLQYYLNDFASTGITYYNLCDKYNVEIDDTTYSCIMFNDEVNITQGLEEKVYTEIPETAETDYTKADKTDRRINQTYLIVDKQNQVIESVVSTVDSQNTKISQISQTVDEINAKISDITDITVSAEDTDGQVELDNVNESEPIQIKIRPIGENISYLYPSSGLFPSNNLFLKRRKIRFTRTYTEEGVTKTEYIYYDLPCDLLYYNQDTYDEFYLDYDSQTCQVTKRCVYNSDGTVSPLATEQVIPYPYPTINLGTGDYTVCLLGYSNAYIMVRLMASNIYTTQFATKVEMNSAINQTATEINLEVSRKVGNDEVISRINQSAEAITINANKINIAGTISAINNNTTTTINGNKITTGSITASQIASNAITADKIQAGAITASKVSSDIITTSNFSAQNINADKITSGTINAQNISVQNINGANITRGTIIGAGINLYNGTGFLKMVLNDSNNPFVSALNVGLGTGGVSFRSSGDRNNVGSQLGHIYGNSSGNVVIEGNNGTFIQDVFVKGSNISSCYQISGTYQINGLQDTYIRQNYSIVLKPNPSGGAYIWGVENYNRILTEGGSPSTLSIKENVIKKDTSDIPNILKQIELYDYKYIDKINDGKKDYGYIIDYLESIDGIDKYFVFNEVERNGLKYKTINHEHLSKFLLGAVIELQKEINSLKEENNE